MNVKKKIVPIICLVSAYVHWIKPRLLSSASKGGKSLLLHLCGKSRFLIPLIVFSAFWIFDAQMQIEASVSLTLNRNVRIMLSPDGAPHLDGDGEDDEADDDDIFSTVSYSDHSSIFNDSLFAEEIEIVDEDEAMSMSNIISIEELQQSIDNLHQY